MRVLLCGGLLALAPICPFAQASKTIPPGLYEVTTEIAMPHLEENLRYATTRERRCLSRQELPPAFPILSHVALQGCRLDEESRDAETVFYRLICKGGNKTTGAAQWHLGANQIRGRLAVKLGGKNMTFSQNIIAKPLGDCMVEAK